MRGSGGLRKGKPAFGKGGLKIHKEANHLAGICGFEEFAKSTVAGGGESLHHGPLGIWQSSPLHAFR